MNKYKITIFTVLSIVLIAIVLTIKKDNTISELRVNHQNFIDNHPFQKTLALSKKERKKNALPPNKYFEQEYLLEMNPLTGKTETEKLFALQEELSFSNLKATPGANTANAWLERGPRNVAGRTRAVMYDPNDATHKRVFAGGVSGGLWVNDNIESGISSWQLLDIPENLAVSAITVDPNNPQRMYLGTGESYVFGAANGNGVWRSEDGGNTWEHVLGGSSGSTVGSNLVPGQFHVNDIIAWNNPATSQTEIFAGMTSSFYSEGGNNTILGDNAGLFKSLDNGVTWSQIPLYVTGTIPFIPNDFEISADNTIWMSTTGIVGVSNTGSGRIFSSIDGINFNLKRNLGARRTELAVSSTDPNTMYALYQTNSSTNPIRIIKTDNQFSTISLLSLPDDADSGIPANDFSRGQAYYSIMIAVDPIDDSILYVGGIDTFRSTNSGASWSQISKWIDGNGQPAFLPYVHADIHELIFHPTDANKGLIATDGGVHYANDFSTASSNAAAISQRFRDYNTSQFYKGAIGQNISQDQFLAGAQDNGTNFINNATVATSFSQEVLGGDGMYCFIDKDGQYMIGSFPFNTFVRLNLPYTGAGQIIVQDQNSGTFVNPSELDDNLNILYTNGTIGSSERVSRFTGILTTSPVRTNLANSLLNSRPTTFKASPYTTASTTLLVGTINGSLLKITNADTSPTWTNISGSAFVGSISAIDFGANENEIMVTFHNYGVVNIWYTENGGSTWQNKEGNFPDIPVKAILMNPLLNDEVIIGTDLGVWRTGNFKDANPTWTQSQNGMKNVKVTSFDLRTADNTVLASTYGRGFFTGQFTSTPLGTNDFELTKKALNIYPTVSEGNFTVASSTISKAMMQVFDMNGRSVYKKQININNITNVSLTLEKGMYIVNFTGNNLKESHKIIIK